MTLEQRATVTIGHWTDETRLTGCTVVLFDRPCAAVVDVRGGAPGTRETDLLGSDRLVGQVDAILLTGGSAFGLGAATGVMRFLHEQGRGVPTSATSVPIVPAGVIYDLTVGEVAWPADENGYAACIAARPLDEAEFGAIGAGIGATYRKLWPSSPPLRGGVGRSTVRDGGLTVTAISVVNAVGDVLGPTEGDRRADLLGTDVERGESTASTLVAIIIDGHCDERTLRRVAISAHDGMARAIVPCHTIWDGDLVFVARTGDRQTLDPAKTTRIAIAAELAVEESIRSAVGHTAT